MQFSEQQVNHEVLGDKGISAGELKAILRVVKAEDLIDTHSKRYLDRGLAYMDFDIQVELLADPLLLRTPIVRDGLVSFIGDEPKAWAELADVKKRD